MENINIMTTPIRAAAQVRRVITGVNDQGRSTILSDAPSPYMMPLESIPTFRLTELWKTDLMPADMNNPADNCGLPIELGPLPNGTTLRFLEFPPDADWKGKGDPEKAFSSMGESGSAALSSSPIHELMHKTNTIDYIIITKGEVWAVLEETETCLKAGDVLIQRGTNHAWSVRTAEPCLAMAVLVDAVKPA